MDPPEIISSNKLLNFLPFWDVTNKQFLFYFYFFSNFSKISCTYLHQGKIKIHKFPNFLSKNFNQHLNVVKPSKGIRTTLLKKFLNPKNKHLKLGLNNILQQKQFMSKFGKTHAQIFWGSNSFDYISLFGFSCFNPLLCKSTLHQEKKIIFQHFLKKKIVKILQFFL